ncbi:hypothetical protein MA16_Dca001745 [Dendrobium catenatum]|uniref:Cytochrome b561 and DOMON domain-containing protein n=1 Tax=Dendrobium catenatum TaxID=906689 RepID=A0A2I0XDE5_9ASPA|nr:hypothetical protein MA16_Dca001745 [Dendrobium catenatum]
MQYSQSPGNILSIVLSAPYTSGWVGMGFSNDGLMVGSSAMVGWIGRAGKAHIRQFYLRGQSSSQVIVNEGRLEKESWCIAIFGWGVLLPIGAIIARYCKEWDLLWFELHLAFQFAGFLFGLAAVVTGISLYNKIHADVRVHRGIGIFLLVLGILQILAFFVRPDKDSKIRRYWNWYHHWVGRLLLFFSAINIILGIKVGEAGTPWKVGYGFNLTIILLGCIFGEIMLWGRLSKKPVADPPS